MEKKSYLFARCDPALLKATKLAAISDDRSVGSFICRAVAVAAKAAGFPVDAESPQKVLAQRKRKA